MKKRIVKLGSVAPDRYFKYGDGYPSLHGFENYIDAFTYISRKADTITPTTSFTYYSTKSTYVQQIDSALYVLSQNWSSYLEGKTVSSRNLRLYVLGMSLHLASDVYAHRAYVYVSSQSAWIPVTHYITTENSSYFDQISADDRYACPNRFELSKWVSRYTVQKWINGTVRFAQSEVGPKCGFMAVLPLPVVSLSDGHSLVLSIDELIQVYTSLTAFPVYPQGWKTPRKSKISTFMERYGIMGTGRKPKRGKGDTAMNVALTIQEKLKDLRVENGLTLEQLEQRTGISKSALGNYETEDYKDISHTSIVTLAKFYGVSADYLLGLTETKNHPNADLAELHLSDTMIELLKSGKINTRLLCEWRRTGTL